MGGKRRRRPGDPEPEMHPRNRYASDATDFAMLASLYPSFRPYVSTSVRSGRSSIGFTDYAATRELTRVLLLHYHGVHWWIPDGQLCPMVPNRLNYIHWVEDLLSLDLIPPQPGSGERVRGFDIGTGANCIYPLLGASVLGWSFVGTDITEVALEWAKRNVENNPQLEGLIEIRSAVTTISFKSKCNGARSDDFEELSESSANLESPILLGMVNDGEIFDFCMCNPPFFESMGEAGLNPKTSCGGTKEEMVYPGGELAFITRIIEDSASLKSSFRWFTSMIGRKANLKLLVSKARELGATIVKTTEFVQGRTARWGLAWSFIPPSKRIVSSVGTSKTHTSFTLQGLPRQHGAFQIFTSVESFFISLGASCKSDVHTFSIDITLPDDCTEKDPYLKEDTSLKSNGPKNEIAFRVSVYQQVPGTLIVRGSLLHKEHSGQFSSLFTELEETLKRELKLSN